MNFDRPIALTIAGLDPSGGAGLFADIKTFEQSKVLGLGVCSSITYQTDEEFIGVKWLGLEEIRNQLSPLCARFPIRAVKFGLIEGVDTISSLRIDLRGAQIVWDPITRASAGFRFRRGFDLEATKTVLKRLALFTPNLEEMNEILPGMEPLKGAIELSNFCPLFLKGGHSSSQLVTDYFVSRGEVREFSGSRIEDGEKHGSGCVLSAAITAGLALGKSPMDACTYGHSYVRRFLESSPNLLGVHA